MWDKSVLPLDFGMTNFSDMEEKTRSLYQMQDDWIFHDDVNTVLIMEPADLKPREQKLQAWWDAYKPEMAERTIPFVRKTMLNNADPSISFEALCILALGHLAEGGAKIDQVCAKTALEGLRAKGQGRVGKGAPANVVFAPRMNCADYVIQNVSIGALHFAAVDMGEDVALSFKMQQALGSESKKEFNQCVIKHLSLALEWWNNGRRCNVPTRSRVETIAAELRAGEYNQALMCMEHIGSPKTTREHELWSSIHDAMAIGHDRGFKRLGWLLKENCQKAVTFCIRIFDYEECNAKQHVTVYQYCMGAGPPPPQEPICLLVADNHIRFLLPSKETFPGSWKRWLEHVNIVRPIEWETWVEALDNDSTSRDDTPKLACNVCGKKCKTLSAARGGKNLTCTAHEKEMHDVYRRVWW